MEKSALLAASLSLVVVLAYQWLMPAPKRPAVRPTALAASSASAPATTPQPAPTVPAMAPKDTTGSGVTQPLPASVTSESAQRSIVVETSTVIASFDNRGGEVTSWRLKHYKDHTGQLVDIIPAGVPPTESRPFEFKADDPEMTARLNQGLYRVRVNGHETGDRVEVSGPTRVTFEYADAQGLTVTKMFAFERDGYVVKFSSQVHEKGSEINPVVLWGPGLGDTTYIVGQKSSGGYVQHSQAIVYEDGKVHRLAPKDVASAPSHQGEFPFAGIDDHYFIATLVEPGLTRVQYKPQQVTIPGTTQQRELMTWDTLFAKPPRDVRFFIGPKDFDVLEAADRPLVKAIYFGIWDFLAVPLLRALKWINGYIGNYGWSIVILTVLINVVLFPLRHKSVVSMRKMQELQPQIKAIQDRYAKYKATDPEKSKMNEELMGLYRSKGVNPASGCVPMVLTMPVLFAFYSLLSVAIEMRGAPFMLWITDLSIHDPYYVTPLIMAATMLWQQRMTPVADPAQAKVMMLTPVMFLFFFLWAPSGLVIYWTVSNLLGIGQQYATNQIIGRPITKHTRPPAERRIKSAGSGATESARDKAS
jgi:YidC/Oxa1 family membrane protein insertase